METKVERRGEEERKRREVEVSEKTILTFSETLYPRAQSLN